MHRTQLGILLDVETGVVGSDLCLLASFSPAESSERSLSVSLTLSSRGSAPGAEGTVDGGPLSLRLLPAVGCEFPASAIMYYVEELLQQSPA